MGPVKMCESGIEFSYESKYKCPTCGSHDRKFKISSNMELYYGDNENVRFEICSCGEVIKIETTVKIINKSK